MQNITIFGAGYVGLTTSVLLANSGYNITLVENNKTRLATLKTGKSFFYESGINELLEQALNDGNILLTDSPAQTLADADVIFSCVGTPDNPDGSSNLIYVYDVAKTVAMHAKPKAIFVQKSTVPVGTGEEIEKLFQKSNKTILYVSNPEFLREGTAVQDSLWFDRVVIGGSNKNSTEAVTDIYKNIEKNRDKLSAISKISPSEDIESKYITTDRNSAELIKVTSNAFLALKISFANSIAKLADQTNADINDVMDAVGADHRIGRAFLSAGRGYGGGCFPKDVSGLISSAADHGVDMPIMTAASDVNLSMPGYIVNKLQEALGDSLEGKNVAVLGLAFKAGTSDARRSPGAKIANLLDQSGAVVTTFDPHANEESKDELRSKISIKQSTSEAVSGVDAVVIATEWPEFINMDLTKLTSKPVFCDAVNSFSVSDIKKIGLQYVGIGRR